MSRRDARYTSGENAPPAQQHHNHHGVVRDPPPPPPQNDQDQSQDQDPATSRQISKGSRTTTLTVSTGGEVRAGPKDGKITFGSKDIRIQYRTADVAKDDTPPKTRSNQSKRSGSGSKPAASGTPKQKDIRSWICVKNDKFVEGHEGAMRDELYSTGVNREQVLGQDTVQTVEKTGYLHLQLQRKSRHKDARD